ncbi:MAG: bifunctional 5,10-methylenetetrahydrofolate dehydrogenase/5,10-methenyltetrahydrofolate cyclohydrolase [Hydrogenobaculum sp.]|nr:MAG: bifunctional methylenetetrahydrofolate dehydrogenase/methenyltetrahydrofolate cyclohydrolase [Hydrogenobaculum sp.]PMP91870.1 MAG: bifunctional methylenetetrahydrofolate dehydrogenase/methenyltetrahydrofolate cyclohydrolase [Hydrogenobaculum sp.]
MNILDGKSLAKKIKHNIKEETKHLDRKPKLVVVLVGDDPASLVYVKNKVQACADVGFSSQLDMFEKDVEEDVLLNHIKRLNEQEDVDGILVQLPLPPHISMHRVIDAIDPSKDVDGFHPNNMGKLFSGDLEKAFIPCTPLGIKLLLDEYNIDVKGKNVCIVGAGFIVGKPLSMLMLSQDATVSICHKYTKDILEYTKTADILISATGVPFLIKDYMVKEGAVVIDVGISKVNGKIVGDVDFESVSQKASFITPVPGGVGPMTVATLLLNTLKAYKQRI